MGQGFSSNQPINPYPTSLAEVIILTSVIMILSYKFAISLGMLNLLKKSPVFYPYPNPTNQPTNPNLSSLVEVIISTSVIMGLSYKFAIQFGMLNLLKH